MSAREYMTEMITLAEEDIRVVALLMDGADPPWKR